MLKKFLNLIKFVWTHPNNKGKRISAIGRVLRWQLASRLIPGLIALPFVNQTFLFATRGMTGATGNWYCGLHEYEDMSFVLDTVGDGDLVVDVGANIGSYSILAASTGAKVIAIEPIPTTFESLMKNILLNDFTHLIEALNIGLGRNTGNLLFSSHLDTINHVLVENHEKNKSISVLTKKLDDILDGRVPILIKIDVEGFEREVLAGAQKTLSSSDLKFLIIEMNGSGRRYGFDENELDEMLTRFNFEAFSYDPDKKKLTKNNLKFKLGPNVIYAKKHVAI